MSFQIIWSDFAESQLDKISDCYTEKASLKWLKTY